MVKTIKLKLENHVDCLVLFAAIFFHVYILLEEKKIGK